MSSYTEGYNNVVKVAFLDGGPTWTRTYDDRGPVAYKNTERSLGTDVASGALLGGGIGVGMLGGMGGHALGGMKGGILGSVAGAVPGVMMMNQAGNMSMRNAGFDPQKTQERGKITRKSPEGFRQHLQYATGI